jgi:RNA polymerase sigma-70 factor (ECF subfamily)
VRNTANARLSELLERGRTSWPDIVVEDKAFFRYVSDRLPDGDSEGALESLHASDLYLACACAMSDARALAAFETHFLSAVPRFIGKIDNSDEFADEVKQHLRRKLFVGDASEHARPKILDYGGRGPLGGWLRVAAIRTARNALRAATAKVGQHQEVGPQIRSRGPDPELGYFRRRYGKELRDAFASTLAGLRTKERNILHLYFLEEMSSIQIAHLYKVEGATIRLWIKKCRANILRETRRLLAERLKLDSAELDSVMGIVDSQLDVSISRLLKKTSG